MRRAGADRWIVDLALSPGRYEYKFVVDGQWEQDSTNPDAADDGFNGFNSVITVPPAAQVAKSSPSSATTPMPLGIRPETSWKSIQYPQFDAPDAPGRTITGRLSPGKEGDGPPDQLLFRLIFIQLAGQDVPSVLSNPATFVVRLHLGDGRVVDGNSDLGENWMGFADQSGVTKSWVCHFPWAGNNYDEAWIEWRLPNQTFWFEIPYGFSRNPAEPWPSPEPNRSEPHLAPAMQNLTARDEIIPWRLVEYDLGEIQNQWRLTARMANASWPAAETVLYHPPDNGQSWSLEKPLVAVQMKGQAESWRVAVRRQGGLDRVDTFRVSSGGSDKGRDTGLAIIRVEDRSYEFTIPSSLFKSLHGRADPGNVRRFRGGEGLFEQLINKSG
jgi:hypothetical protein